MSPMLEISHLLSLLLFTQVYSSVKERRSARVVLYSAGWHFLPHKTGCPIFTIYLRDQVNEHVSVQDWRTYNLLRFSIVKQET